MQAKCDNCGNGERVSYSVYLKKDLCDECASSLETEDRRQHPGKYLKYCNVPEGYRNCSLDNFLGNEKLVAVLREYVQKWPIESLLLTGICGCGKSHLAVSILAEFVKMNVPLNRMYFISFEDLLMEIRRNYDDSRICDSEEAIIQRFREYDLLLIDDIGATQVREFQVRILYNILEKRVNVKKTIVTTNLIVRDDVNEIEEIFGARIGSRLAGFRIINIQMDDYRKKRK